MYQLTLLTLFIQTLKMLFIVFIKYLV